MALAHEHTITSWMQMSIAVLIDWIAEQGTWLEAVTVLEAVNRCSVQF